MNCPITGKECLKAKTIHVTDVENNEASKVMHLCEDCGSKIIEESSPKKTLPQVTPPQSSEKKKPFVPQKPPAFVPPEGFQVGPNIPNIFDVAEKIMKGEFSPEFHAFQPLADMPKCKDCGHTVEDIANTKKLGCPNCYSTFIKELIPVLQHAHQGETKHVGKKPKNTIRIMDIKKLEEMMDKLVKEEKYEEAAKIRDQIKELNSQS